MDPITALFSAYLDIVNTAVSDHLGTEIQAVVIEYNGQNIPFQHQLWRVKDNTVCAPYKSRVKDYSLCTLEAKELFSDLCSHLSKKQSTSVSYTKYKNMYCNAAISYKPTVALISEGQAEDELSIARQKCNAATIAELDSENASLRSERKKLCDRYNALRLKQ